MQRSETADGMVKQLVCVLFYSDIFLATNPLSENRSLQLTGTLAFFVRGQFL